MQAKPMKAKPMKAKPMKGSIKMTRTSQIVASKITTWGLLATLAATTAMPVLADPDSRQKNKNNWRNLGIAGAVVAGYGLLTGDKTATVLGAAGATYSADRYETDRRHQSQDNSDNRRYYRSYGWQPPVVNGDRDNNGNYRQYSTDQYSTDQYSTDQYESDYDRRGSGDRWDTEGWTGAQEHHGRGWYKNHGSRDGDRDHRDSDHWDSDNSSRD